MSIQINYKNSVLKKDLTNLILFVDEKFKTSDLRKYVSNSEFSYISELIKSSDIKNIVLLEFISKRSKSFFKSLLFISSEI